MLKLSILLILAHGDAIHARDTVKPVWPTQAWLSSTAEEQGMDSAALAKLVAYGESHSFDSLLVVRHGRIVTEAYYAPYTGNVPHEIFSSTKAITGSLLGMVYKDGLLDRLDHPMLDFFPDRRIANVDDRKKEITVQNLLDMTSGLDWDQGFMGGKQQSQQDMNRASNMIQFILDRPMAHPPGEVFNYSDGNANLISAIITTLTGKPAEDYAREKLFTPLGIVDWHWDRDPQELTIGNGMLFLLPRDMAKIGYLYLHHGQWEGKQLLPLGWADVLSHSLVNMHAPYDPTQSYSNFIWVFPDKRVYMANGKDGQLIVVFPDLDIVVVTTARKQVRYNALIDAVSGAVKSESALPPNADAAEQLSNAIKNAAVEKPTSVSVTPEIASAISGKRYSFPDNSLELRSITLFLTGPRPHFKYERYLSYPVGASVEYDIPIGLDGFYRKGSPALFGSYPGHVPAAKGSWSNGSTFVIDTQDIGYGTQIKYVLSFSGKKLNFRRIDEEGWEISINGEQGD
ncbi:class C beta-lactamase-related serine hydrolase [Paraburkholderia guartelaensis]|uniref:Class C beta-lactamase-related serine hydrolase n=2 Tax=Paraburkholderia guartelaensis TaxID=2546446 RepID=A0A4R5L1V4_9BURK|nr:class C beta-lactamase-related serine hydrolase [Paraburkholderia guartelaensis]